MTGLAILVALAASGVDFGWQPTLTGLEFILQMEPAVAQSLLSGESPEGVYSVTPSELRGARLNRLRVIVGEARLPQAFQRTAANQRVTPRGVREIDAASVGVGWRPSSNNSYELIVQLSRSQMQELATGAMEVVVDFPPEVQAEGVHSFRIVVGAQPPRRVSFSPPASQSASPPALPPSYGSGSSGTSRVMGASATQNADDYRDPNRRQASPIADPAYRDGRPPQAAPLPDLYSDPYGAPGARGPYDPVTPPASNPADGGRLRTQIGPENPQDYREPASLDPRDLRDRNRQINENLDASLLNDPRRNDPRAADMRGQSDIYGPGFPDDPRYRDDRNYAETMPPDTRANDPLAVDPRLRDPRRSDPRDPRAADPRRDPRDPVLDDRPRDYRDYPSGGRNNYADDRRTGQAAYPDSTLDYPPPRDYRSQAAAPQPSAPGYAAPARKLRRWPPRRRPPAPIRWPAKTASS